MPKMERGAWRCMPNLTQIMSHCQRNAGHASSKITGNSVEKCARCNFRPNWLASCTERKTYSAKFKKKDDTIRSQWYGTVLISVIWHVSSVGDPGCLSPIPDPNFFHPGSRVKKIPGSRIRTKEFTYFNTKKLFLSSRKYDPKCSFRIRILIFYPSRTPASKTHRIPDPQHCTWAFQDA
jgi:hypothetical protein